MKYDIIGDVHGYAGKLEALLLKMGYSKSNGCYRHPHRKTLFVGDLIDRGNENFKTLEIVKAMWDNQQAQVVLGNHEFNALCYHTSDAGGNYLRPHNRKNNHQHKEVLTEIEERGDDLWQYYLEWFRLLPLFLETDGLRIVHACWSPTWVDFIRNAGNPQKENDSFRDSRGRLSNRFLEQASRQGTEFFEAVEVLLKGKEMWLPKDFPGIYDKDGHLRKKVRIRWWLSYKQRKSARTYAQITRIDNENLELLAKIEIPPAMRYQLYDDDEEQDTKSIFIGHYWYTGTPRPLTAGIACLDYSVGKGGDVVGYRWDGEDTLEESKFRTS